MQHPNQELLALGIQQPWVELILRGIKTIEIRRVPTQIRGPIYLYASKKPSPLACAEQAVVQNRLCIDLLPRGAVVGVVEILNCRRSRPSDAPAACVPIAMTDRCYSWELANPQRCPRPLPPQHVPFGMWFYPFRRLRNFRRR